MKILAVIIARGGSKGIPKKNLVNIGGMPLVAHMIGHALQVSIPMDVVVSTEDKEIAKIAMQHGAEVPFMRPVELAEDNVPSLPVVQHAVRKMEQIKQVMYDIIVYLQPTAPLCRPQDIETAITKLLERPEAQSVVAITEVATHPFRMKRLIDDERVINFIDQGFEDMRPRQVLPKVYRRAGSVYVGRRSLIMEQNTLLGDPCLGVQVPLESAIDIDSELDLELARHIYEKQNKKRS